MCCDRRQVVYQVPSPSLLICFFNYPTKSKISTSLTTYHSRLITPGPFFILSLTEMLSSIASFGSSFFGNQGGYRKVSKTNPEADREQGIQLTDMSHTQRPIANSSGGVDPQTCAQWSLDSGHNRQVSGQEPSKYAEGESVNSLCYQYPSDNDPCAVLCVLPWFLIVWL